VQGGGELVDAAFKPGEPLLDVLWLQCLEHPWYLLLTVG
jgi:hypothetical protein